METLTKTHEEKIVRDFLLKERDSCPYVNIDDLSDVCLDGYFDFTELVTTLTTYRAQVLEEVFNAKLAERVRVPSLIPGKITTWEVVSVEELEHPTN